MRRRLLLAFLGIVTVTLLITGLGTLVLSQTQNRDTAEQSLVRQAEGLAITLGDFPTRGGRGRGDFPARAVFERVRDALRLQDASALVLDRNGQRLDDQTEFVFPANADLSALLRGETISGDVGDSVYAAAPIEAGDITLAVTLTADVESISRPVLGWFLVSAALALALASLAATALSRRFSRPLIEAGQVTRRVADGDLGARMDTPDPAATDEGADLARSVNTMVDSLERSQGLERQFLLSVSHDLRTPMTSIQGYAEALTDGAIDDPQKAGRVILAESRRLDRLVRDLLDLARLDAKKFSLTVGRHDLRDIAGDAVDGFQHDAATKGLAVAFVGGDAPLPVQADADRLGQVLANLIENAMRFASHSVRVEAGAASDPTGRSARVVVTDDGPGIATEDLPHLFDRLYQSRHQPEDQEAGTGVGLTIAFELTIAMGGTLRAAPSDTGAVFVLELPLAD